MSDYTISIIGKKIKAQRKKLGMTINDVAIGANVSKGLVSKIENGRTIPSLPVLISLLKATQVKLDDFFSDIHFEPQKQFIHIKSEDYQTISKEDESKGFKYQLIASKGLNYTNFELVLLTLSPGNKRKPVSTDAWEVKFMIKGTAVYQIGDNEIVLEEGDSLFFNARVPHVPINRTDQDAVMLVGYLYDNE